MAIPLYAQALVVCHEAVGWPSADGARAINNAMYERPR
jgi:hypothetical protein